MIYKSNVLYAEKRKYLTSLFKLTYYKDIVDQYKKIDETLLDELMVLLAEENGSLINSIKIASTYNSKYNKNVDYRTIDNYINYFIDSFLINKASRYDLRGKKKIGALKKYYFIDVGLRNAIISFIYSDIGQNLENIIYNELIYNDFNVEIGIIDQVEKNINKESVRKTYEVDFFARKNDKRIYIQVCNSINNNDVLNREIKPFILLEDNIAKVIVVNDPYFIKRYDENNILFINIVDFLLDYLPNF